MERPQALELGRRQVEEAPAQGLDEGTEATGHGAEGGGGRGGDVPPEESAADGNPEAGADGVDERTQMGADGRVDDPAESVGDGVGVGEGAGVGAARTRGERKASARGPGSRQSDGQARGRGVGDDGRGREAGHGQGEDPVGVALDEDRGHHHGIVGPEARSRRADDPAQPVGVVDQVLTAEPFPVGRVDPGRQVRDQVGDAGQGSGEGLHRLVPFDDGRHGVVSIPEIPVLELSPGLVEGPGLVHLPVALPRRRLRGRLRRRRRYQGRVIRVVPGGGDQL